MDPLSQAVVGAAAAGITKRRERLRMPDMLWAGALGGMAPDLDVLIRSSTDPLLALEYHRHFTHALIMSPVIGFLVGWLLWLIYRAVGRQTPLHLLVIAAIAGAATHGLLDTQTSYGTLLFWPFSHARVSTDFISIIDPIFTLPLLVGCIWAGRARSPKPLYITGGFALVYLGVLAIYQYAGTTMQSALIAERGHVATHQRLMPGLYPPLTYRSAYRDNSTIYVDTLRLSPLGKATWIEGTSVPLLNEQAQNSMALPESNLARDLKRFNWFADGFLAAIPDSPNQLGDYRYFSPNTFMPFWGIGLPENRTDHVQRLNFREMKDMLYEERP